MKVPLLDLKQQYQSIKAQIVPAVLELMESQQCVLGETVEQLEQALADYSQCAHAVGVSSGTDALLCSLMALGIGPDDEVIVPTFTFYASAGSIARVGAKPVFVDIDRDTFNIDLNKLEEAITDRTKAIMPVHLYGQMAPMAEIMALAKKYELKVIEDACQAIGSDQNGHRPGQLGDCASVSFYPTKNLSCFGDGGMILCEDEKLADLCRSLRVHGGASQYHHSMIGGNFRLDALQAVVVGVKLKYLDGWQRRRQAHAKRYDQLLGAEVGKPRVAEGNSHVYHQYVIRAPSRDQLRKFLADKEIGTAIFYPSPLHLQECFAYLGGKEGDCPVAEQACKEVLALPVVPELTDEQIEYVTQCINEFYG